MTASTLIIQSLSPQDNIFARESIQMAMAFSSLQFKPDLLFCGEGVLQLVSTPSYENKTPNLINSLIYYDITTIWVEKNQWTPLIKIKDFELDLSFIQSKEIPQFTQNYMHVLGDA